MGEEIESLHQAWKLGSLPKEQKLVGCKGVVDVKKLSTHDILEDMMTKAVSANKFRHCLDLIGVYINQ
ncbi:hypothetical protein RDI58_003927 [Solanum bulbocastanum]|uniref:Uncharacterized protein n=1 Tax=Solanum bulbocastanum TaxID=147425 RepID=A0AAN8YL87_SOLBU